MQVVGLQRFANKASGTAILAGFGRFPSKWLVVLPRKASHRGMKHYILISITIPPPDAPTTRDIWRNFLFDNPAHKPLPEGGARLAENVWLLDRATGVNILARLVSHAEDVGLKPQVQFLKEDDE